MDVGKNIHAFLKRAGVTQRAFARRMGLSEQRVSDIVVGRKDLRLSSLERLARDLSAVMVDAGLPPVSAADLMRE